MTHSPGNERESLFPTADQSCWLIERGQPEGQVRPTWWVKGERPGFGAVDLGAWTTDAFAATRFETKDEAEAWLPLLSRAAPIPARAVQHGFARQVEA